MFLNSVQLSSTRKGKHNLQTISVYTFPRSCAPYPICASLPACAFHISASTHPSLLENTASIANMQISATTYPLRATKDVFVLSEFTYIIYDAVTVRNRQPICIIFRDESPLLSLAMTLCVCVFLVLHNTSSCSRRCAITSSTESAPSKDINSRTRHVFHVYRHRANTQHRTSRTQSCEIGDTVRAATHYARISKRAAHRWV